MAKRLRLFSFALYDTGETILGALVFSTLYPLYITKHIDVKTYSLFYGFAFFLSFVMALQLGRLADKKGWRKRFFTIFSLSIPTLCLMLFASFEKPLLNFLLYLVLAIFHQQALVFYNSLLKSFETKGFASGFGVALGYVGSATALIFLAPSLSLPMAFLWVAFIFFSLSLPSLLSLSEPAGTQEIKLLELIKDKGFILTMASMLFLMELAHTMIAMMGVYLREVYGLSQEDIYKTIGFSALGGVFGGLLFGRLTDKLSAKRLFPIGFFLWSAFLLSLYITPKELLLPLGFFAGLSLAHLWTTSRVFIIERFPGAHVAVKFSFYSLSERIASSLGLVLWSFFLLITGEDYRLSALFMLLFPALGFVLYLFSNRLFEINRL